MKRSTSYNRMRLKTPRTSSLVQLVQNVFDETVSVYATCSFSMKLEGLEKTKFTVSLAIHKSLRLFTIYMKTSVRQQLHKWQVKMLHSVIFVRIWSFIIWYIYLEPRTSSRWSQLQMESTICTRIVRWEILDKHVPFISDIFRSAGLKLSHHDLRADRNFKSLCTMNYLHRHYHLLLCMSMLGFSNLLLHYLNCPL